MEERAERGFFEIKVMASDDRERWETIHTRKEPRGGVWHKEQWLPGVAEILLARRPERHTFVRCEATVEGVMKLTDTIGEEGKNVLAIEVAEDGVLGGYIMAPDDEAYWQWRDVLSTGNHLGHAAWWTRYWAQHKRPPWTPSPIELWYLRQGGEVLDPKTCADDQWLKTDGELPEDVLYVREPHSFVYWEV